MFCLKTTLLAVIFLGSLFGCGVKGRPLPPLEKAEIGYGRPQYQGANKSIQDEQEESDEKNKIRKVEQ